MFKSADGYTIRKYKGYTINHFIGELIYKVRNSRGELIAVKTRLKDAKKFIDERVEA